MAIPTFPGVFIVEVASGVRTIAGVPTAVAAFVGRTPFGRVNDPVIISNFGEFERNFGGLTVDSSVGYAVRDFFLNGGGQAVVVRLYRTPTIGQSGIATITFDDGTSTLALAASSPGTWADDLVVIPGIDTLATRTEVAEALGLEPTTANANSIFNLEIRLGDDVEIIRNLTLIESPRRYDKALAAESRFVRAFAPPAAGDAVDATFLVAGTPPVPLVPTIAGALASAALERADYQGNEATKVGIPALEKTDIFNMLCIPPDDRAPSGWGFTEPLVYSDALAYCQKRRAMLVIDPPPANPSVPAGAEVLDFLTNATTGLNLSGVQTRNAVVYFPRVLEADPLRGGAVEAFVPCGIVAGVMARTDGQRGVWKAPAGIDAGMGGIRGMERNLSDADNGQINPLGVNALRTFPIIGSVVWGARTLRGADVLADEYKYLPVRRLALFIEESLFRGTKFAVFEPNDEPLWSQIRLNVGAFLNNLFRQGAFQGQTAREAYFVKCDEETTTQNDINLGVVNVLVGFAPLKPAEFVVIKLQQIAGPIAT
jgi:uncharacterized protein